jgi:hypothetical protein
MGNLSRLQAVAEQPVPANTGMVITKVASFDHGNYCSPGQATSRRMAGMPFSERPPVKALLKPTLISAWACNGAQPRARRRTR